MSTAPYKVLLTAQMPALAADVDGSVVLGEAPFDGTVTAGKHIPNAAITGANSGTNNRKLAITNRGQNGLGIVEAAHIQYNTGVNAAKWDREWTTLDPTAANRDVLAGDVLTIDSTTPGTSTIPDPGGVFIVELTRK